MSELNKFSPSKKSRDSPDKDNFQDDGKPLDESFPEELRFHLSQM